MQIGIVGAGEIARNVHLPVLAAMPEVRVGWIHDRDAGRAAALASAFRLPAVSAREPAELPAGDVVLLAIPVEFRRPYLLDFARRGIAVFCEKPFAATSRDHAELVAMFPAARLACGYMRRFYRSVRSLRWLLDQGLFGPLRRVRYAEGGRSRGSAIEGSFLDDPALGRSRGVLTDLGSHGLDTILNLVRPRAWQIRDCELVLDGTVDRKVAATVELGTTALGHDVVVEFCVSWLDHQANRLELHFDRATVWCGVGPDSAVYVGEPGATSRSALLRAPVTGAENPNQAFYLEWAAFLAGVASGSESAVSAASAAGTTGLVDAIHVSGRATGDSLGHR